MTGNKDLFFSVKKEDDNEVFGNNGKDEVHILQSECHIFIRYISDIDTCVTLTDVPNIPKPSNF